MFFSSGESEKKGKEVKRNLYYFSENQMLDCNQYIIQDPDTNELTLFDAGNGLSLKGLFKGLEKCNLDPFNITKVFLTHEHVDHTLGLYPLMTLLKDNPPEILAYGETAKILREGDISRIFPGNLGIKPSMFGVEIIPLDVTDLMSANKIKVCSDYEFQIHYTPGHSLGSISYYDPNKKILIPGDLVFRAELLYNIGSFGRYDFPGGSLDTLKKSIEHVFELDVLTLLPGHMGIVEEDANLHIALSYKTIQTLSY
ncbi:MAG: MBL fold metallo-hydrolase [Promethearchaeota archaeon]|nr:MAG: MBL fold metallo-hydrolase [Candidatus Lokiarchaeota archaeon]